VRNKIAKELQKNWKEEEAEVKNEDEHSCNCHLSNAGVNE